MPHLELLDWEDRISMPNSMFNAFACSSIQHLKLFRVAIEEEFEIELPVALAHRGWPLRTLHLELHWRIPSDNTGKISTGDADVQCLDIEGRQPPNFANLQDLDLGHWIATDSSTLDLLLCAKPQSRLKVLDVNTEVTAVRAEFFQRCGAIPSLETFVWSAFNLPADHNLSFLSSNPQLLKLSIPYAHPPEVLDQRILPLLSQSFRQLKSLSLTWEADYIAETALEQIGTLGNLEQLSLSAGEQFGWRHNWVINHRTMRRHLGNLEHLRKLAFQRDSYKIASGDAESYYENQYRVELLFDSEEGNAGDREDLAELSLVQRLQHRWEEQHRKRILLEADRYVRLLPKLEWLYFGQIPMGVTESAGTEARRKAVPLSPERDDCYTLLGTMFGR
ncbi:hypothetical protein GJ744_005917 [Endocarpon pusillum]|uniref:F-box domain-containing protein n=1 Tax=Endocarpon pusillum TaxID=364733 RepID=A0A8H7APW4_9EURO|nr:hypothetical protein GJ744_005917 [Endocarpon pusillum]